jgi:hypothetical protein
MKKTEDNKFWQGNTKEGTLCTVGGNVDWCSHIENSIEVSKEIKNRTTYDPEKLVLGILPEHIPFWKKGNPLSKDICTFMNIITLFTSHGNNLRPLTKEWIKKNLLC